MAKNKKITFWTTITIVFVVVIGWFISRGNEKIEYETEKAQRKIVFQTVSVTGELTSKNEIDLNFEIGGRIKSINVHVGQKVARGDIIGVIDDEILDQEYNQAEVALNKALAEANANDDAVREVRQSVESAEDYLKEVEDLENQKVDAVEQIYKDAKDYYDDALSYYNKVVDDDGVDSVTAKSTKLTLDTADAKKNAARDAIEIAEKTRDLAIISAENSLKDTKERLKTARSDLSRKSRDSSVQSAQFAYNIALMNLEKSILKASVSGIITEINYESGEVINSSFGSSNLFAKIITTDFVIEANIPESDIVKIKKDQSAEVTFDALDESESFVASVIEIDPASTVIQDVVYYRVKLLLQSVDARLKAGMSTDIDIHSAEKKNVIAIPRRAVRSEGEKKFVDVLISEDQVKKVEVKTGLRGDEGEIEIISGIKEGDNVITLTKESK